MAGSHAVLFSLSSTALGVVSSCAANSRRQPPRLGGASATHACLRVLLERVAQLLVPPVLHETACTFSQAPATRGGDARAALSTRTWYSVSHAGCGGSTIGRRSRTQAHTTAAGVVAAALSLRCAVRQLCSAESAPRPAALDRSAADRAPCAAAASLRSGKAQPCARRSSRAAEATRSIAATPRHPAVGRECRSLCPLRLRSRRPRSSKGVERA